MRYILFDKRFEKPIRSRQMIQTVRPRRKQPFAYLEPISLHVWTGTAFASKQREIAQVRFLVSQECCIHENGFTRIICYSLTESDTAYFAMNCGYPSITALLHHIRSLYGFRKFPFHGELLRWTFPNNFSYNFSSPY